MARCSVHMSSSMCECESARCICRANGRRREKTSPRLAFKEDHYCFADTDIPEVAQRLVQRLAKLWQVALASELPVDDQSKDGVKFMLVRFKETA